MSQPITWQNVNQGDASTAWRAMDSAQRSINGAFDGLQSQITKSEDIQAKNDVAIKQNNTQDFLNKLNVLGKTPEALQAAIADGSVEQLKAGYGNAIDHNAVRGAAESLLDQRYKQVKQGVDFNNAMLDEKLAPIMDKFKSAVLAGNKELADKYRSEYTAADGKHGSDLESFLRNNTHENQVWDEQQKGWVRDQGQYEANLKNMAHQQRMAEGQLGVAQGSLSLQQRQQNLNERDRLEQQISANVAAMGEVSKASAASPDGTKAIIDEIGKMADPAQKRSAYQAFNEMKLKNPNILTGDAMTALMGTYQRWWRSDSTIRGETTDTAAALANSPSSALQAKTMEGKAMNIENQNARLRAELRDNAVRLGGGRPAPADANPAPGPATTAPAAQPAPPPVDNEARLRRAAVEEQRRKDAVVSEFKLKADIAAGGWGNRREQAQVARVKDVQENFDSTVGLLKRGAPRADIQKALSWIDSKEEAGVLSNAQLKQIREARKQAGL